MFFLSFSYLILICSSVLGDECKFESACKCKTSKGTVDLSKSNYEFTFEDAKKDYTYRFKPCGFVSQCEKPGSDEGTVCQTGKTGSFDLGDSSSAAFSGDPETNSLVLNYTTKTSSRKSVIHIRCQRSEEGKIVSVIEDPQTVYIFELQTRHACFEEPHKISTGSVLLIIFFVVLGVYFIAGMVFLKFVRGAQGTEMIPNYDFWTSLPGYIKDGVLFTCRGCKAQSSYSKI